MERGSLCFAIFVLILHRIQAQNQTGFISLDCGLSPSGSPYNDFPTGLTYISDSDFIQSGRTGRIASEYEKNFTKPLWTLRYFPDGVRNCYNLNVTRDTNYLIRTTFAYGNYDGLNTIPDFDLYLGPNLWATVNTNDASESIIHVTKSNLLQVCLVKTGTSVPIMSTLELRPLRNDTYVTQSGSLKYFHRAYLSTSTLTIRYPDDVHDRKWFPLFSSKWAQVTTSLTVNISNNTYELPQSVMSTGAKPINDSPTMDIFKLTLEPPNTQFYVYMHFAELETLKPNETREFNTTTNGQSTFGPYSLKPLRARTIYDITPEKCDGGSCLLQLVKTPRSTLPPFINAFEVFTVIDFSQVETNGDDVASIKNIQDIYGLSKISWQGDPCLPKQFSWDGLNCDNSNTSMPPIIISLNMSSSGLTGNITQAIQNLTHLQQLDLSNNSLVGGVPDFLATMKSLVVINLSGNNLSGQVPQILLQKKGLNIEGNPYLLCGSKSCLSKPRGEKHRKKSILVPIIPSIVIFAVLMGALVLFFVLKKKKSSNVEGTKSDCGIPGSSELVMITKNRRFTYSEVVRMTSNFQRILGKGGFGMVYHGFVDGTTEVAVKLLTHPTEGYKQFKAEVELLLKVYHRNLVSLVGYCNERENLALIYEYMANGDLKKYMSGMRTVSTLNWRSRLQILIDSALGLEYLHNGCKPSMIHRDVKTANILLNEHLEAKLADFGLSRSFLIDGDTHVSTDVAGTQGYLDPEYCRTHRFTKKSDVYSFGIVLLEIITNQRVIDQSREKEHIAEWAELMLSKGDITSIMDPGLNGDFDSSSVRKVVELSMCCLNPISENRPTMSEVVIELNESLASEISRGGTSGYMNFKRSIQVTTAFSNETIPEAR